MLASSDFTSAFTMIKNNPTISIDLNDAKTLLNNINALVSLSKYPHERMIEVSTLIYKRFDRQRVLRGFGCVGKECYPEASSDISPARLELVTGMTLNSLTPRERYPRALYLLVPNPQSLIKC